MLKGRPFSLQVCRRREGLGQGHVGSLSRTCEVVVVQQKNSSHSLRGPSVDPDAKRESKATISGSTRWNRVYRLI